MIIGETDYTLNVPRFADEFGRMLRVVEKAASGDGVGVAEGRVLFALRQGEKSPARLSKELELDTGQLARLTKSLESKNLIARLSRPGRTRTFLALTPAGVQLASKLAGRQREEALRIFGNLTDHERERFVASVKHLEEHLYQHDLNPLIRDAAPGETGLLVHRMVETFCSSAYGYAPSLEGELSRGFADLLDLPHFILVAERQRSLGGAIAVEIDKNAQRANIRLLSVFQYQQGSGVGTHLLQEATERARWLVVEPQQVVFGLVEATDRGFGF